MPSHTGGPLPPSHGASVVDVLVVLVVLVTVLVVVEVVVTLLVVVGVHPEDVHASQQLE